VPGCVPVAVPGCCTASAQNPHSTPWRRVPVPRASDRIVSVRLGGSRCRGPATGRPSTRRVTAPGCHGRAGRAERRIGALEGQIYGAAACTQINLICVRTLAERGHVGASALAETNGGNACRPESSLRHRSWSHPPDRSKCADPRPGGLPYQGHKPSNLAIRFHKWDDPYYASYGEWVAAGRSP
jgi:hypothetical protein